MRRDFTKSNKEYFKNNRIALICLAVFLVVGIVVFAIFGMNGNFEIKGYTEFSINATADTKTYTNIYKQAEEVVNCYDGNYDSYQIFGEGDNTEIIIRYTGKVSAENQAKINVDIAKALNIEVNKISTHTFVEPVVDTLDYVYTITAFLLLITLASIFAYFRYNGASAISIIISCVLGSLIFLSIGAILRLSIGMSYFAMLVILNLIIVYFAFNIFENMRKYNWLANNDYDTALTTALKETKLSILLFSLAIMIVGVLFVVIAPATIKFVSLNILFIAVVVLAVAWYILPFVWSVLITSSKKKEYNVKVTKEEN